MKSLLSLAGESRALKLTLTAILAIYVLLATWEINWGTPQLWHPDEKQGTALRLIRNRTVNPGDLAYGGLPYYMLALGAGAPALIYGKIFDPRPVRPGEALDEWQYRKSVRNLVAGRLLSVLLGAGVILITFALGRALFDSRVGLLAAATLAVSPYFIAISHFAIVDMAGNFWYWLAMLLSVGVRRDGGRGWYFSSAFALGLATGVKLDRVLGAVALLVAHFVRGSGLNLGRVLLFAFAGLLGYALANLMLFTEPFAFLQGVVRELFFGFLRGTEETTSFGAIITHQANGLGLPALALAGIGLLALLSASLRGRDAPETLWLLATIVPAYLLFGSRLSAPWYAPFYFPALAILAGYAVRTLVDVFRRPGVAVAALAVPLVLGWSVLQSVAFDYALSSDARYRVQEWLREHARPGSLIEVGSRAPYLSPDEFRVVRRPRGGPTREVFEDWRDRLENHAPYQRVRAALLEFERRVSAWLGRTPGPEYQAWVDQILQSAERVPADSGPAPDFKVVLDGLESHVYESLSLQGSGYRLVTTFEPVRFMGQAPTFPFVNPRVWVFARDGKEPR